MAQPMLNVLFVCEGNSVRSIMAEALLNRFGGGRFRAFSAGLEPARGLHPLTVEMLRAGGMSVGNLQPKSISEFTIASAPRMDFVIAMGKNPAAVLGALPGTPIRAQWGISDPIASEGEAVAQRFAFRRAWRELETRIRLFVLLRHHREERTLEAAPERQSA